MPFRATPAVPLLAPSPRRLRVEVHPLLSFTPLQSTPSRTRHALAQRLPWGLRRPLDGHERLASLRRASNSVSFRPRRFARPRRFNLPYALWVYFTPLPSSGFSFGSSPPSQLYHLVSGLFPHTGWFDSAESSCPPSPHPRAPASGLCSSLASVAVRSGFSRSHCPFPVGFSSSRFSRSTPSVHLRARSALDVARLPSLSSCAPIYSVSLRPAWLASPEAADLLEVFGLRCLSALRGLRFSQIGRAHV